MKNDTWMPFYIADYLRDTMHLSTEEHGAYILLLFSFWFANGSLSDCDQQFANITRLPLDRWKSEFRPILIKFFKVENGVWIQKRVQAERLRALTIFEARSSAGRLGGRPKKQTDSKPKAKQEAKQEANQKQNETPSQCTVQEKDNTRASGEAVTPTREEVRAWAQIDGLTQDQADAFFNYYDGLGWMKGNTRMVRPRSWLQSWREKAKTMRPTPIHQEPVRNQI